MKSLALKYFSGIFVDDKFPLTLLKGGFPVVSGLPFHPLYTQHGHKLNFSVMSHETRNLGTVKISQVPSDQRDSK